MKKGLKVLSTAGLAAVFAASVAVPTQAAVIDRVLEDTAGTVYQYDEAALGKSYTAFIVNEDSKGAALYKHYLNNIKNNPNAFVAFNDDKAGYVTYESVQKAFNKSIVAGEDFNLDTYTESGEGVTAEVKNYVDVTVGEDGAIVETPVTPPVEEVTVQSVSAINQTIASGEATNLKFAVNGEEELTKAEFEEKYEGYTASFLFNTADHAAAKVTGKVTATKDFKYAVQVTDAEGNKLPEEIVPADFVEVKVVDATIAVEVTSAVLSNDLTYLTVGEEDVVVNAAEALNGFGDKVKEGELPPVEKITSSDVLVAYADTDNEIVARKAGNVTFTVKFAGITEPVTMNVEVKAKQAATTISVDKVKVALSDATPIKFNTLDQNDEALRPGVNPTLSVKVSKADGTEVTGAVANDTAGNFKTGKAFVAGKITEAGTYTVEVLEGTKKIGSYTLEIVDTAQAKVDEFKIVSTDGKPVKLDIKDTKTANVNVSTFANGVRLAENIDVSDSSKFVIKSQDEDVVTAINNNSEGIKLTAGTETGTANVDLYTKEGDLETKVATIAVEVVNTTPQITTLTFKDNKTALEVKESVVEEADAETKLAALKEAVVAQLDANVEGLEASNIADVSLTPQGKAIVTVASDNGGKEFVLDTKIVDNVAPQIEEVTITDADGNPVTGTTNGEITVTVDALDTNLTTLEIDTFVGGVELDFSLYADGSNPYGTVAAKNELNEKGLVVSFDAVEQVWTLVLDTITINELVQKPLGEDVEYKMYFVVKDKAGNVSGHMGLIDGTPATAEIKTFTINNPAE